MIRNRRASMKVYAVTVVLLCTVLLVLHENKKNDTVSGILLNIQTGFYFVTRIPVGEVYLYSAVATPDKRWDQFTGITINVWDGSQNKAFDCCLFNKNNIPEYIITQAYIKNNFGFSPLEASQYQCEKIHDIGNFTHVGMVERGEPCTLYMTQIQVIYPTREIGKMAICAKIAYGSLSPQRLIEWFEYQRLMGVDKVLTMVQYLNDDAYKVLEYYKTIGFGDIDEFPSPLPGVVVGYPDRGFEGHRFTLPQCSHDKQVGVYSCQEKLQGYDYVGVIDFDEYIVHEKFMTYKDILKNELLSKYPDAAGFTFNVSFFILDWGDTGSGDLYLTKYVQRTEPRYECFKNIYIPDRIKEATTHTFHPKPGFKRYVLSSNNIVMHHYRECPKVPQWQNCLNEPRTKDFKMNKIREEMVKRVKSVQKLLGFPSIDS